MTISSNMTVRDVAIDIPQATRVFEKLKIDYCCGGKTLVTEACTAAGVEIQELERMLEQAVTTHENTTVDFHESTLAGLITHILDKHHVYTKSEINRLEGLFGKVISAHGLNHPELHQLGELFQNLSADLTPHMFKEENILFPYMLELERSQAQKRSRPFAPFGTVNNPIRMMSMEHDTVGDILRAMRNLSRDYTVPPDVCISYKTLYEALEAFEQDLHQHIHLENNILFPRAIEMEAQLSR